MHQHHHDDATTWDRFYADDGDAPHWSGQPNPSLVAEVAELAPGRALDVGCGEGGDAIWLARRGWQVTAIDPSGVAIDRAHAAARAAQVEVDWIRAGLLDLTDAREHDLVTAHYAVLPRGDDDASIAALLRAVAPGGTLLFVHHELDRSHATEHGGDPAEHVMPHDLAGHLDGRWEVEVLATREHVRAQMPEDQSPRDVVLRARRRHDR